ncbi:MAG: lipoprotein-releasing system transmembrane subunit LolC [Rhizobiales bacterium TMED28]|nr:lipoprotein-releasing system transmembrane subunit LolC [Rhodobiaceae bacterium]OUT82991.1 MAG: lipoprotein-releasing system transmembrane subunit LolC [Rhizobiales bacterium TMED28]
MDNNAQINKQTLPFASFEWKIAFRYLRSKKKEGFISIISLFSLIGIMLGVATLIIVLAVMNGFRSELLDKILGINGHITIQSYGSGIDRYDEIREEIGFIDNVYSVVPTIYSQVMVSSGEQTAGAIIKAINYTHIERVPKIDESLTIDRYQEKEGLLIGSGMARSLMLGLGDSLTLISPKGSQTPFGTTPRIKSYPITGIFNIGMSEYDSNFVYMPLQEAQKYFNKKNKVNTIEVFLDNPEQIDLALIKIREIVDGVGYVSSWRDQNKTFFTALEVERDLMFIIVSLIVLVAGLNIISSLIMLVKDKNSDIAILRTIGASKNSIIRIFFITGSFIGVAGTTLGVIIGILFCQNIDAIRLFISKITGTELFSPEMYYLAKLPAEIDNYELLSVVTMALSFSILASIYPSWKASKIDPVEVLRNE